MKTLLNKKTFIIAMMLVIGIAFAGFAEEALYIDAYGNVGIGTSSPYSWAKLTVAGDAIVEHSGTPRLMISDSSGNDGRLLLYGSSGSWFWMDAPGGQYVRLSSGASPGTNPMVLTYTGRVGIGTTSPGSKLTVSDGTDSVDLNFCAGTPRIRFNNSGYTRWEIDHGNGPLRFFLPGVVKFQIETNGNATLAGRLTENSDIRYKKDIVAIPDALDRITQIRGVNFNWKGTDRDPSLQMGLIAQDVEKVFPELVCTDENGYKSVSYTNIVAALVESIKELKAEVSELKGKDIQQKSLWDKIVGIFN